MVRAVCAFSLSLLACGDKAGSDGVSGISAEDERLATELWAEIEGYGAWSGPADATGEPTQSASHSGAYVVTYLNEALAAWDGVEDAPAGAIAVKEAYAEAAGETLNGLTVMKKVDGYDEANGDWFWASYSDAGEVRDAGAVEMCASCHAAAPADFVYAEPPGLE